MSSLVDALKAENANSPTSTSAPLSATNVPEDGSDAGDESVTPDVAAKQETAHAEEDEPMDDLFGETEETEQGPAVRDGCAHPTYSFYGLANRV